MGIIAGILLLLAIPLTILILGGILGRSRVFLALNPIFLCCGIGAHIVFAIVAFWEGYRALKFSSESAWTLLGLGVGAILAGIFLLGGILGILAGVLLIIAGALVFAS